MLDVSFIDWQSTAILALTLGAGGVGWIIRSLVADIKQLAASLAEFSQEVAETYQRRDDFRESLRDIKDSLHRIESKVDARLT